MLHSHPAAGLLSMQPAKAIIDTVAISSFSENVPWNIKTFNASNAELLGKAADPAHKNNATVTKTAKT